VAGTLLSGRYRIVGLLGKGGMGEVYKAEDLKLRQLVALKFLPDALSHDGGMLARFHREVRAARQITHANVCRVHDIGETAIGRRSVHFLSMEYIDGEDLAVLLRRIGRFTVPKGVELARQLCSGLGAAHDAGMVHRDLKPANIMLDGRGRARITDFGLSGLAEEFRSEEQSGTPAYMAPEQMRGAPATPATDIYALGLVLYELFTGKRPFDERDTHVLINLQDADIPPPSTRIREIDPVVERAILRCLARQPGDRPKSAYEVASALPGGDPLAAALAVGETPSPEMVAASGEKEGLRPLPAWSLVLGIIAVLLAVGWVFNPASSQRAAFKEPPEFLVFTAKGMMNKMGYSMAPADSAFGVRINEAAPEPAQFWYRESPHKLLPGTLHTIGPLYAVAGRQISEQDPPPLSPGMLSIRLDATDRLLRRFHAIPATDAPKSPIPFEWTPVLKMAGLDPQLLDTAEPQQPTSSHGDRRVAWRGGWPGDPSTPLRVEGAEQDGRPIYFEVFGPRNISEALNPELKAVTALRIVVVIFVMISGVVLAWRNLKEGKGDRRGAFRLSLFAFVSVMLAWVFGSTHRFDPGELNSFVNALAEALYWTAISGVMYLAVEPFVRRRYPHALISWNRLLEGRFGDSLVGRDILVGVFLASLVCIIRTSARLVGITPFEYPEADLLQAMHSMPQTISFLFGKFFDSANITLALFFLFCFMRAVLRNPWFAAPVWLAIINALTLTAGPQQYGGILIVSAFGALWFVAMLRFGVTAGMAMWFADRIFRAEIMLPPQGWHAGRYYVLVGAVAVLALYAFARSLGKHSFVSFKLMDEKKL
jgi:serine/threonine-protein kinase